MKATKTELTEYQVLTKNLKRTFKNYKLSYKDVAREIGLSESGVKKVLSARDGSFQRITQMCKLVGVSVGDLLQDTKVQDVTFSSKQQEAFLNDLSLFKIYWMLVYERQSTERIQTLLKISYKDLFAKIRKLDAMKLILLLPSDRIRIPSIKAVAWVGQGEFINKIYKAWTRHLLESVSKPKPEFNEFFTIRYLPMTPKTYKEFQMALSNIEKEFVRRSIHEMRTSGSDTHHVRCLMVADDRSFIDG